MEHNNNYLDMELLRFTTAGSVDDGKSTLIGRLLYDSKAIFEDQLEQVKGSSERKGLDHIDLSLLTDGLKDEREQGITIDVAYRYFATPKRKFIIADTPGHIQYTRNMVTGASTANVALILIDARKGVIEQTYRHSYIASLLQIPHIIVCINKMDLVSFSEEVYQNIVKVYEEFASKLEVKDIRFIPISALKGDNVVNRSNNMDWYQGATLMHNLETIHIGSDENHTDARFPIQTVIRPHSDAHHDFRGYAGRIDGGIFRVGEEIVVLPSGKRSTIKEIFLGDRSLIECFAPMSVSMTLNDDIDISRGNIIAKVNNQPEPSKEFEIAACWFHDKPLNPNTKYIIRQGTSEVFGKIEEIIYKMEITTLTRNLEDKFIGINDIFKAKIRVSQDLFVDSYHRNRKTGSLIVIDQTTNETIAVGMIS
jgi:sulfate adenylyltransferase subunit 1